MLDYIKDCIPDERKRLSTFSYDIHSNITRSSDVLHMPKGNTTRFGNNTLSFDSAKLWNKFYLNC